MTNNQWDAPHHPSSYGVAARERLLAAENLNELHYTSVENDGKPQDFTLQEPTAAMVRPVFRNIEQVLVEQIQAADYVVGCVAWLTSVPILEALAEKKGVSIVVQQEDWLRPDSNAWSFKQQRKLYAALPPLDHYLANANVCGSVAVSPIRLSGKPKMPTRNQPRMHNKFLLLGTSQGKHDYNDDPFHTVWTGSYNLTANATNSLENGLLLQSPEVVRAYWSEWRQILLSSYRIADEWWGETYCWSATDYYLRDGT